MQVITLPCPNASNYDPANRYRHFVEACNAIDALPIPLEERRRIVVLIGNVRTEAFCHGNSPDEPF